MIAWRNTPARWGLVARTLHWAVAAFVVGQFVTGWLAETTADRDASFGLIRTHFQAGMTLLGLIVLRVLWRLSTRPPAQSPTREVASIAAVAVHGMLYGLLLVLPISGYLIWVHMDADMKVLGLVEIPRLLTPNPDDERLRAAAWYVHYAAGWALAGLTLLHIAAAAWHGIRRDGVLSRMV